jgi:hypothetical protein
MRTVKWNAFLSGLCASVLVLGVVAGGAYADVTIEKGASILVFPKVRVNSTTDTVIQITNTGNSMVHAHCFYVDGSLTNILTQEPCSIPSLNCTPSCNETDFDIWLTTQQPTHWLVSAGRRVDPTDGFGNDGSGFDPGRVPPTGDPFDGELKCIEVSESGEPITGNHLKGEATIKTTSGDDAGDVSTYNAIGIQGNPDAQPPSPPLPLLLDGNVYNACPAQLFVNHSATFSADPVAAQTEAFSSSVSTELTLVPCSEDFENQLPTSTTIQFEVFNEFEERFSASTTVTCFLSTELTNLDAAQNPTRSIFSTQVLGTDVATTTITPNPNSGAVIGVTERTVSVTNGNGSGAAGTTRSARAAYNIHGTGDLVPASGPDQITLPGQ